MKTTLTRINKAFHYEAINKDKIVVHIDANEEIGGEGEGVRPMELVLMGLGGCASIDLGLILKKQRQELVDYQLEVNAIRNQDTAKAFKSIQLHFILTGNLDSDKVEKAIKLTITKYCSVALSLSKDIDIISSYEIKN